MARATVLTLLFVLLSPPTAAPSDASGVDRILVEKAERRLTLFAGNEVVRAYTVSFGASPVGQKQMEGDERTPEGQYRIEARNPRSSFHLALRISYPNASDKARAAALGVAPGGDIMIHGMRNGLGILGGLHRWLDWTDGCIAVTNSEMDEIWDLVKIGTPIEILP